MPDHFNWLIELGDCELQALVLTVKSRTARSVNAVLGRTGQFWQRSFHDRAIRREEDVQAVARYIIANPIRAGLVKRVHDYPLWDAIWVGVGVVVTGQRPWQPACCAVIDQKRRVRQLILDGLTAFASKLAPTGTTRVAGFMAYAWNRGAVWARTAIDQKRRVRQLIFDGRSVFASKPACMFRLDGVGRTESRIGL